MNAGRIAKYGRTGRSRSSAFFFEPGNLFENGLDRIKYGTQQIAEGCENVDYRAEVHNEQGDNSCNEEDHENSDDMTNVDFEHPALAFKYHTKNKRFNCRKESAFVQTNFFR